MKTPTTGIASANMLSISPDKILEGIIAYHREQCLLAYDSFKPLIPFTAIDLKLIKLGMLRRYVRPLLTLAPL